MSENRILWCQVFETLYSLMYGLVVSIVANNRPAGLNDGESER